MSGGDATLLLVCTVQAVLHSVTTERLKNALQQATGIDKQRQAGRQTGSTESGRYRYKGKDWHRQTGNRHTQTDRQRYVINTDQVHTDTRR